MKKLISYLVLFAVASSAYAAGDTVTISKKKLLELEKKYSEMKRAKEEAESLVDDFRKGTQCTAWKMNFDLNQRQDDKRKWD